MAIPANYDIQYYRGNTYEFYIQPKDIDCLPIDVTSFTPSFIIATSRGPAPDTSYTCSASATGTTIHCTITAGTGATLSGGTVYVYDVSVDDGGTIHTYLTGNVYVTDRVEEA